MPNTYPNQVSISKLCAHERVSLVAVSYWCRSLLRHVRSATECSQEIDSPVTNHRTNSKPWHDITREHPITAQDLGGAGLLTGSVQTWAESPQPIGACSYSLTNRICHIRLTSDLCGLKLCVLRSTRGKYAMEVNSCWFGRIETFLQLCYLASLWTRS